MEMVFTYILELSNGKHYTGITKDIARRLDEHRKGMSISTRKNRPVKLIWLQENEDRKRARKLEVKIKRSGARRFMKTYVTGNWGQLMIEPLNEKLDEMIGIEVMEEKLINKIGALKKVNKRR